MPSGSPKGADLAPQNHLGASNNYALWVGDLETLGRAAGALEQNALQVVLVFI